MISNMKKIYHTNLIRPNKEGIVKYTTPHIHYVVYVKNNKKNIIAIKNFKTKNEAEEFYKNYNNN
jgi:hypothetical protein